MSTTVRTADLVTMTPAQILNLPVPPCDAGEGHTVRSWLIDLLSTLWQEEEGFSGKRPWGNSGWTYDVFKALLQARVITGELDEDGYVNSMDSAAGDALIAAAIKELAGAPRELTIRHQRVTLLVPFEEDDREPREWDWPTLLGTVEPVVVLSADGPSQ